MTDRVEAAGKIDIELRCNKEKLGKICNAHVKNITVSF